MSYENELQLLIDKVEGIDNKSWEEMVDELHLSVHPDSLRKSFNAGRYSGYAVAKYYQNKFENEYCTQDEIDRLEQLKKEVYKEKIKYQDARREYRKELTSEARFENLIDVLKAEIVNLDELPLYHYGERVEKNKKPKDAILALSDWHIGAMVDTQWNCYSVDIAKERMEQLLNKVKRYILNYNITNLVVEINGDMVHGLINVSNRVQSEEDVVSQIIIVSDMLSYFINELKPYVRNLKVVTTLGNHGRLIPNKKESINKENMEMLIPEFLKLKLDKDINILTSNGLDFIKYKIGDKVICLSHGQYDKVNEVIEDFSKMYKCVPNEIHLGHTHSYKDINDSNIYITVNGSLMGSDEYAVNLRKITKPSQNLIIYDEDRCIIEITVD